MNWLLPSTFHNVCFPPPQCSLWRLLLNTVPWRLGSLSLAAHLSSWPLFVYLFLCLPLMYSWQQSELGPNADGLSEIKSFELPVQPQQLLPDKDVEGHTRMDVKYLTLCLIQICGSVIVPSYTGKIFGSLFCRTLHLQEQRPLSPASE